MDLGFCGAVIPAGLGSMGWWLLEVGFYGVVTLGFGALWGGAPWMQGSMGQCPLDVGFYGSVTPGCGALCGADPWM